MRKNSSKKAWIIGIIVAAFIIIVIAGAFYTKGVISLLYKNDDYYYDVIKESIINYDSSVVINVKEFDENSNEISIANKVLEDNIELSGELKGYDFVARKSLFGTEITLNLNYHDSKEALLEKDKAVKNKVKEIVSEVIKPDMKDYEKEKALHDYIINNSKYDERLDSGNMPWESYTAYGILIDGVGVCQGYAVAMDKLLKAVDIKTEIITGEALNDKGDGYISHAWNIVEIGGQNYHLDLTWNDPVMEDGSDILRYSYFNITDDQISANHKWDTSKFPKCDSSKYSFENLNLTEKDSKGNDIIVVKNYNELSFRIKEDLSKKVKERTYKMPNFDGNQGDIPKYINNACQSLGKYGEYGYAVDKDEITKSGYIIIDFSKIK